MELVKAIQERHSVRSYKEDRIGADVKATLEHEINVCNKESGLHIQLVTEEPRAFDSFMAHYGKFHGVNNYIALIGKKDGERDEKIGYYGERIALLAQQLGLNTCWVAMSFSKRNSRCDVNKGEKLVCVLSLGYGENKGIPHKSKPMESLCRCTSPMPDWFKKGMESAILAPTAMNQQKFLLTSKGKQVKAESTGGFYSKVDLGIVKYHFEIGAGKENFSWV